MQNRFLLTCIAFGCFIFFSTFSLSSPLLHMLSFMYNKFIWSTVNLIVSLSFDNKKLHGSAWFLGMKEKNKGKNSQHKCIEMIISSLPPPHHAWQVRWNKTVDSSHSFLVKYLVHRDLHHPLLHDMTRKESGISFSLITCGWKQVKKLLRMIPDKRSNKQEKRMDLHLELRQNWASQSRDTLQYKYRGSLSRERQTQTYF